MSYIKFDANLGQDSNKSVNKYQFFCVCYLSGRLIYKPFTRVIYKAVRNRLYQPNDLMKRLFESRITSLTNLFLLASFFGLQKSIILYPSMLINMSNNNI